MLAVVSNPSGSRAHENPFDLQCKKDPVLSKTLKCPCLCSCRRGSICFNDSLSASLLWIFHLSHALNLGKTISSIINFGRENFIFMRNLPILIKFYSEDKLLYLNIKNGDKLIPAENF